MCLRHHPLHESIRSHVVTHNLWCETNQAPFIREKEKWPLYKQHTHFLTFPDFLSTTFDKWVGSQGRIQDLKLGVAKNWKIRKKGVIERRVCVCVCVGWWWGGGGGWVWVLVWVWVVVVVVVVVGVLYLNYDILQIDFSPLIQYCIQNLIWKF